MNQNINLELREATVSNRIKKLGERLNKETAKVFKELKLEFEPRWFVVSHFLHEKKSASINEISSAARLSHPAVIQIVNRMIKKKLIDPSTNSIDKRKRIVKLTTKGETVFNSIHPALNDLEVSIKEMNRSAGYDILHVVESFENVLNEKSLSERMLEKNKKRMMDSVEIIKYSPHYKEYFKQLNYEWLQKYLEVEKEDIKILSNPESEIIKKGGEVFFARYEGEIVGTCAAIKIDDESFELAKLGVTEKAQGKQIGKKLALAVVGFAYAKGARAVLLETTSSLKTAIHLYESLGFKYIPTEQKSKYSRPTFWMKLDLK